MEFVEWKHTASSSHQYSEYFYIIERAGMTHFREGFYGNCSGPTNKL